MCRRTLTLIGAACVAATSRAAPAVAQETAPATRSSLPRDVRREAIDRWNGQNALRATEQTEIAAGQEVSGNVAVQHGPLLIAGHVTGNVLALNSSVVLRSTAHVDGTLLVIGGHVEKRRLGARGRRHAHVRRLARVPAGRRTHRGDHDRRARRGLVVAPARAGARRKLGEGRAHRAGGRVQPRRGMAVQHRTGASTGSRRGEASTPAPRRSCEPEASSRRTATSATTCAAKCGSDATAGIGIGGRVFSVVDPVEDWQLSSVETALAAFLVRRDYRDYFQRHGATAIATLYGTGNVKLTGTFGEEHWDSRSLKNPFTLFNDAEDWRPNPEMDAGVFHVGTLSLTLDTRTDQDDPWSGWLALANVEHGAGTPTAVGPTSAPARNDGRRPRRVHARLPRPTALQSARAERPVEHARRARRLARAATSFRSSGGCRSTVRGRSPGYDFRSVLTPNVGDVHVHGMHSSPGQPAACERIALAQVEYRGDLTLRFHRTLAGLAAELSQRARRRRVRRVRRRRTRLARRLVAERVQSRRPFRRFRRSGRTSGSVSTSAASASMRRSRYRRRRRT